MRTVNLTLDYLPIEALVNHIDQPYRNGCQRILRDHRRLFETVPGSTHNHQTWPGGYIDHITDGMNYARHLYRFDAAFGRPLPFTLSDALLVFFLHDLEKPWRIEVDEKTGQATSAAKFQNKEDHQRFREQLFAEYGLMLLPHQLNAIAYAEGEVTGYSSKKRTMNELASFCHKVDNWCARGWYDYPKLSGDEWIGARRFRVAGGVRMTS